MKNRARRPAGGRRPPTKGINAKPLGLKEDQSTEDHKIVDSVDGSENSEPQNVPRKKVLAGPKIGIGVIDFNAVVLKKTGANMR